jgi:sulfite reductase (ferredoxin)
VFVTGAKALLTTKDIPTNTQYGIVRDFDEHFGQFFIPTPSNEDAPVGTVRRAVGPSQGWGALVFSINKNEPTETFARYFVGEAEAFLAKVHQLRQSQLAEEGEPALELVEYGMDS